MKLVFILVLTIISCNVFGQNNADKSIQPEKKEIRKENRTIRKQSRVLSKERREISGELQLSGAFALYPLAVRWAEEFRKLYPNIKIDISAGGAGKGITDALNNMVDLGMVSREIHKAEIAKGAISITVAKDAVVATINARNPIIRDILFHGMQQNRAYDLWYTKKVTTWGQLIGTDNNIPIHPYTRSDACGASETWAAWLNLHQENLEGTAVYGDPGVASVVQRDKVAIGFNNMAYAYDMKSRKPYRGIMVMPLDINNNGRIDMGENFYSTADQLIEAIINNKYPSPPSRNLYLVCNGKPTKDVLKMFLEFILIEGQQYNRETLFIPLSESEVDQQLEKIR